MADPVHPGNILFSDGPRGKLSLGDMWSMSYNSRGRGVRRLENTLRTSEGRGLGLVIRGILPPSSVYWKFLDAKGNALPTSLSIPIPTCVD